MNPTVWSSFLTFRVAVLSVEILLTVVRPHTKLWYTFILQAID